MSKQLNQQGKRMCKILIGEMIIVWSKYFKIRYRYFSVYITEKFSKYLIRRFLNGCWSMQHQETLVQILPNAFIKMGFCSFSLKTNVVALTLIMYQIGLPEYLKAINRSQPSQLKPQTYFSRSVPSPNLSRLTLEDRIRIKPKFICINNKNNFLRSKCFPR